MEILKEWDEFYGWFWMAVDCEKGVTIDFSLIPGNLWRASWFIYFIGSFYKHNGETKDENFVKGAYLFLYDVLGFVDGEPFDLEGFFFKAFPK